MTDAKAHSAYGLENHGLRKPKAVHWNLTPVSYTHLTLPTNREV